MKRVAILIIIGVIGGGAVGYGFSARSADASIFEDFVNLFRGTEAEKNSQQKIRWER